MNVEYKERKPNCKPTNYKLILHVTTMCAATAAKQVYCNTTHVELYDNIYYARRTVLHQLQVLGFEVEALLQVTPLSISIMVDSNSLNFVLIHPETKRRVGVCFLLWMPGDTSLFKVEQKLPDLITEIYRVRAELREESQDTLKVITNAGITNAVFTMLYEEWNQHRRHVLVQDLATLKYNVLENRLVPKHTPGWPSPEGIRVEDLGQISQYDPVALAICLHPDEICKIDRPSMTAIESTFYRRCILPIPHN